jgi:hypothetical protein
MSPNLGIIASSISGHLFTFVGNYDALATVTVPAGGLSNITFAGIPQTGYSHLQVRCLSRNNSAAVASSMSVGFNGDTTSSYTTHLLIGNGSTASVDASTAITKNYSQVTTGNNSTASVFSAQIIDILDYANTSKNKTLRALSGLDNNGSGTIRLGSSLWINTSAINSIQIYNYGGSDFIQHSQFALYGVKA